MTDTGPRDPKPALTLADIDGLPPTLDMPTAARVLGISRSAAYQLAAANKFPVPVLHVGHSLRVPTARLLALLGLPIAAEPDTAASSDRCSNATLPADVHVSR